jgi:hypothetical protein
MFEVTTSLLKANRSAEAAAAGSIRAASLWRAVPRLAGSEKLLGLG